MTPEEIKRLRELCDAATEGPWDWSSFHAGLLIVQYVCPGIEPALFRSGKGTHSDAQFIAAAREAVPKLLDEVERLQAEVKAWQRDVLSPLSNENKALCNEKARLRAELEKVKAERDSLQAKLAGECETCEGSGLMSVEELDGDGNPTGVECVECAECLGSGRGWMAEAVAERDAWREAARSYHEADECCRWYDRMYNAKAAYDRARKLSEGE